MSDYESLSTVSEEIIAAAIESAMAHLGLHGSVDTGFTDNSVDVSAPDGHRGGGVVTDHFDHQALGERDHRAYFFRDIAGRFYNKLRDEIEDAFHPWYKMPDPHDLEGARHSMNAAAKRLDATPGAAGGQVQGAGHDLVKALNNVLTVTGYHSTALNLFNKNYTSGLALAIQGQHALAVVIAQHLTTEQTMWKRSRADVIGLADQALVAMQKARPDQGSGLAGALSAVGTITEVTSIFDKTPVSGTVGTLADIVGKFLPGGDSQEDAHVPLGSESPFTVVDNLARGLAKLNRVITHYENDIYAKTTGCLNTATSSANHGSFNVGTPNSLLHDTTVGDYPGIDADLNGIHTVVVPGTEDLSTQLHRAAREVDAADVHSGWLRRSPVGVEGHHHDGPYAAWQRLLDFTVSLLRDTSWEITEAGRQLDEVAKDLNATDAEIHSALVHRSNSIHGSPYDTTPSAAGHLPTQVA